MRHVREVLRLGFAGISKHEIARRTGLEAAATRALDIGARTYGSVKSILDNNLDRHATQQRDADGVTIIHPNIRGSRYYH